MYGTPTRILFVGYPSQGWIDVPECALTLSRMGCAGPSTAWRVRVNLTGTFLTVSEDPSETKILQL